jgi:hypothetical protein
MTWIFSLSAEFGERREPADNFAAHYTGMSFAGAPDGLESFVFQDADQGWWCTLTPRGNRDVKPDSMRPALACELLRSLHTSPSFRFALVGEEVGEVRTWLEALADPSDLPFDGLVLPKQTWDVLGRPEGFVPFGEWGVWRPYPLEPELATLALTPLVQTE